MSDTEPLLTSEEIRTYELAITTLRGQLAGIVPDNSTLQEDLELVLSIGHLVLQELFRAQEGYEWEECFFNGAEMRLKRVDAYLTKLRFRLKKEKNKNHVPDYLSPAQKRRARCYREARISTLEKICGELESVLESYHEVLADDPTSARKEEAREGNSE